MNLLTILSLILRASQVPWVDLAKEELRTAQLAQQVGAERLAITARFTRAKALALAGVDSDAPSYELAYEDRMTQLRSSGDDETADLVAELQRQADAEERWSTFLAEQNATATLQPGADEPAPVPAVPRPTPPPRPSTVDPNQAQLTPPELRVPGAQETPPSLRGQPAQPTPATGQPAQPTPGGSSSPAPAAGTPADPARSNDSRYLLTIPKLGITDLPVVETDIFDQSRFLADLHHGVAHDFCNPDEPCKSVIFGHSSGYANDPSPYKRAFVRLNELEVGDTITVNYRSRRYTYTVFKKEIVAPTAVQILKNYNYEELTLFTCWPINTWQKRLVVYTKRT